MEPSRYPRASKYSLCVSMYSQRYRHACPCMFFLVAPDRRLVFMQVPQVPVACISHF